MRIRPLIPVLLGLALLGGSTAAHATPPLPRSRAMSTDPGTGPGTGEPDDPEKDEVPASDPGDPDVGKILLWIFILIIVVVIGGSVVMVRRRRRLLQESLEARLDTRECLSCGSHRVESTGPECYRCRECNFEFGEGMEQRLAEERQARIRAMPAGERIAQAAEDLERARAGIHQALQILRDMGPNAKLDLIGGMVSRDLGENVLRLGGAMAAGRRMLYYSGPGITPYKPPDPKGQRKSSSKEQRLMDFLSCLWPGLDGARDATEIVQTIDSAEAPPGLDVTRWSLKEPVRVVEEAIQQAQLANELRMPLEGLLAAVMEHQQWLPAPE